MVWFFKKKTTAVQIMGAILRGRRVDAGMALSVGLIWTNGVPTDTYGVWSHVNGPDRKPGALELATADPLFAAETFVRIRDSVRS